ncbi:MFS transporter [Dokdonia sp. Hel_I_53]|uniref:MFS transporter n=1 Tax=Dokdonia sp. Hel_I_53 TaxID=1566287 RepID=UPI00119BE9E8|nr:MFS transporter [Dokdonia sp. Hel_I_53]TVZ51286.1 sugar phosphate permease [Dokdonia sp. Hel_I_53]
MKNSRIKKRSIGTIVLLILAGEAVFILPFVIARIFRPTLLEVLNITNTELGYCFSIYGIAAMISYGLGGFIADVYEPRKLITISLFTTALGGIVLANNPTIIILQIVYGYWGVTTIFLFWAAMIKATRLWGGTRSQGKAFGFLDGGRGMVGVILGIIGVSIFAIVTKGNDQNMTLAEKTRALHIIIYGASITIALIGILVYYFLKFDTVVAQDVKNKVRWKDSKKVLRLPSVWLLMVIIVCAYFGYKITDILPQFASDVLKFNAIDSGKVGTYLLFIRPIVGVSFGYLADRSKPTKYLLVGFALCLFGSLLLITDLASTQAIIYLLSMTVTAIGVYAARVLYFAVLAEGNIPVHLTGTAVGIISLVGYTPDIFAGPMIGYYLDNFAGRAGYNQLFIWFALFSLIGILAAVLLRRVRIVRFRESEQSPIASDTSEKP